MICNITLQHTVIYKKTNPNEFPGDEHHVRLYYDMNTMPVEQGTDFFYELVKFSGLWWEGFAVANLGLIKR